MKTKTILALSLASNAVLLSAVGYINAQNVAPFPTQAFIHYVYTNSPPGAVEQTVTPAPAPGDTVVANQ